MKNEKVLLPIGTVCILKNAKKKIMIIGYYPKLTSDKSNKTYDYSGCLYPEGLIASNQVLMFDHDKIEEIFYLGYSDDEGKKLRDILTKDLFNKYAETNQKTVAVKLQNTVSEKEVTG